MLLEVKNWNKSDAARSEQHQNVKSVVRTNAKHRNMRNPVGKLNKSFASSDQKRSGKSAAVPCFLGIVHPTDFQVSWGTWLVNALWQSGDMGEKCNKKVVNFGNWFLCQFSPKTYKFLHGASLTPQKSGDEKKLKKYGQARGEKSKKCEGGVFHRQDWSQFKPLAKIHFFCKTNICEKHPLIAKKWDFILKNRNFCYFFQFLVREFKQNSMN